MILEENILEDDIFDFVYAISHRFFNYQLYQNTNEDLTNVLSVTDFKGKEVLSVMASADQVFSAYYLGANSVDTFDTNRIAYYYFYLRKWCLIKYKEVVIPNHLKKILEALEMYDDSKEEEMVSYFWRKVIDKCIDRNIDFFNNYYLFDFPNAGWTVPYSQDIDKMVEIISSKKANFMHQNIFLPINSNKKYHIIILSNILEFMLQKEQDTLISNLHQLLLDDGIVICSNLRNNQSKEYKVLEQNGFLYQDGAIGTISTRKTHLPQTVSYTYRKVV